MGLDGGRFAMAKSPAKSLFKGVPVIFPRLIERSRQRLMNPTPTHQ
jgi:hypothetical protein